MSTRIVQHVIAGCATAACLSSVASVSAQRAASSTGTQAAGTAATRANAAAVVPFKIQVPGSVLTDLRQRLAHVRFADEFPDAGWDYGTNLAYLTELVDYWRDTYDWRTQEKQLNAVAQFRTNIDGVDIYFIHQRSKNPGAMPLLLLNGWPSSIVEYQKVIGPLTDPVAYGGRVEDSFNVVVPSMPGFGFSGKPRERGYDPERIARIWVQLMARLGYSRYSTHGSDWGAGIATRVALDDPAHVAALHLAGCGGTAVPATAPTVNRGVDAAHNLGYQEIQSTKPQTLGQGLSDSPVGLASWIVEKWYDWSDHDGDLSKTFTKDEILNNVMIYWVTNSGASSARIYYESRHMLGGALPASPFVQPAGKVAAPTGCGAFPTQYDRRASPLNTTSDSARAAAAVRFNLVHFTTMPHGGHFPALEQPNLWVDDIRTFFRVPGVRTN